MSTRVEWTMTELCIKDILLSPNGDTIPRKIPRHRTLTAAFVAEWRHSNEENCTNWETYAHRCRLPATNEKIEQSRRPPIRVCASFVIRRRAGFPGDAILRAMVSAVIASSMVDAALALAGSAFRSTRSAGRRGRAPS